VKDEIRKNNITACQNGDGREDDKTEPTKICSDCQKKESSRKRSLKDKTKGGE